MTTALAETERRRLKASRLRALGVDPFPHLDLRNRQLIRELIGRGAEGAGNGSGNAHSCQLAGRIVSRRKKDEATLLELRDRSGTIRLRFCPDPAADIGLQDEIVNWDIGDVVAVAGELHGDGDRLGVEIRSGRLLTKSMQLNHGLSQPGHRPRRRELELMAKDDSRVRFQTRARLIASIREWLNRREFIEVETPVLQPGAGGALARPFSTSHNALGRDLTLRISTQLHLRRCAIGDLERVSELGKCFRNEGMSIKHSPEFTLLEWSLAYSDYRDSAALIEQLVSDLARSVLDDPTVTRAGHTIDLERPWRRVTLREAIEEAVGLDILAADVDDLTAALPATSENGQGDATEADAWSDAVHLLYSRYVEANLVQPTIVYDFPLSTNPCMKRHPSGESGVGESFDIVIGGVEIASGGSEVNDPDEQWERFVEQRGGNGCEPEAHDREYVAAMSYGAPPSSGAGLGIDRVMMLLLGGDSIADVTLFPTLA
jgi:lysyl-tRNA synthetase, class II